MTETYRLLRHRTVLMQTMNSMLGRMRTTWEGIRLDDGDIRLTVVFLLGTIRKLVANQYRHYMGKPEEWVDAVCSQSASACHLPPVFWKSTTVAELKKVLVNVHRRVINCDFSNTFEVHGDGADSTAPAVLAPDVDEEGDDAASVPLVCEDEIADTIYEGEELESEDRSTEELKGSLQRVQAVARGRHGDSKNITMPAEGKVAITAQGLFH
jgi:hypothetical protein